jgi:plastocyanin
MTRHSLRTAGLIAGCLTAALLLNACGGYSSPTTPYPGPQPTPTPTPAPTPAPTPSANAVVVEILGESGNMSFNPALASLQVGQQVRWHNADTTVHTATQDGGGFDTGFLAPGATSASITLSGTGSLKYHCAVHPSMVGALNVTQ